MPRNYRKANVDKSLINIAIATVGTANNVTILVPAVTFPCTVGGPRICLSVYPAAVAAAGVYNHTWIIVFVRQGQTASTIGITAAGAAYSPEGDVMLFGCGVSAWDSTNSFFMPRNYEASSSTKRKLMLGDRIEFVARADTANNHHMRGIVQIFAAI